MGYDIGKALDYAHKWANGRNPSYFYFDAVGGDCTNFVSQCLYSGCGVMNYTKDTGWYYNSVNDRAAAWSGVEYLYRFLLANKGAGPFGEEMPIEQAKEGDVIQLSFNGFTYVHSLIVVGLSTDILVATHSIDSDNRPLNTYEYRLSRLIRITGVRQA